MSEETLEIFTRQYIEAQSVSEITFAWQGGEPTLMGIDFFTKALEMQRKCRKPGVQIHNTIQTNGTLLNDDWGMFLKQHNFLVGISLDGPRELHDVYRRDKGRQPTFDRVMRGLEVLQRHQVEYNILCCLHAKNVSKPLEVYRFLREEAKANFIQFIPIVERDNETGYQEGDRVTTRSITGRQYGDFLIAVFNEWIRRDVGRVFIQLFDVTLGIWYQQKAGLCIFEETCGMGLAMEHTGDVFSCDHFVEPGFYLGNIHNFPIADLVASKKQVGFGQAKKTTLPRYCQQCEVRFACNGGCPKDRILKTPEGEPGLNYLCEGYRTFFNYVDTPMRVMTNLLKNRRPPAMVMELLRGEDQSFYNDRKGGEEIDKNAPCPCGSGRKYGGGLIPLHFSILG
jgi:uncharacterized protein